MHTDKGNKDYLKCFGRKMLINKQTNQSKAQNIGRSRFHHVSISATPQWSISVGLYSYVFGAFDMGCAHSLSHCIFAAVSDIAYILGSYWSYFQIIQSVIYFKHGGEED